jgi:hypothetical protein
VGAGILTLRHQLQALEVVPPTERMSWPLGIGQAGVDDADSHAAGLGRQVDLEQALPGWQLSRAPTA